MIVNTLLIFHPIWSLLFIMHRNSTWFQFNIISMLLLLWIQWSIRMSVLSFFSNVYWRDQIVAVIVVVVIVVTVVVVITVVLSLLLLPPLLLLHHYCRCCFSHSYVTLSIIIWFSIGERRDLFCEKNCVWIEYNRTTVNTYLSLYVCVGWLSNK